jgi:hypothetical protein
LRLSSGTKIIGIDTGASFTRLWDGEHEVQRFRTPPIYTKYLQLLSNLFKEHEPIQALAVALAALVEDHYIIKGARRPCTITGLRAFPLKHHVLAAEKRAKIVYFVQER